MTMKRTESSGSVGRMNFYSGVFVISGAILALQILQTRLLSIMSWYFLAFFAISMAMLGMTAGSLLVYFFDSYFERQRLRMHLARLSLGFAISTAVGLLFLITSLPFTEYGSPLMAALVWLKLIVVLTPPYVFGGMVLSLALTRSPYPVSFVYAFDLIGAGAGCFAVLVLMNLMDGVSAVLAVAALGACSAALFRSSPSVEPRPAVGTYLATVAVLLFLAAGNT